jgi:hypothetical protein
VQRIGFYRIDLGAAPAGYIGGDEAKQQPAEAGGEKGVKRVERDSG